MKSLEWKFLPQSMTARHLFSLGIMFFCLQIVLAYGLLFFWSNSQIKISLDSSAMHFAQAYGVLCTLKPEERFLETEILTARRIHFKIVDRIPQLEAENSEESRFFYDRILTILTLFRKGYGFTYLGDASRKDSFPPFPRHAFWEAETLPEFKRQAPLLVAVKNVGWRLEFSLENPWTPLVSSNITLDAVAALPFYDGTWFVGEFGGNLYNNLDLTFILVSFGVQFLILMVFVWIELRMLLSPLRRMEKAAARINLDNPEIFPIPERGYSEIKSLATSIRDLTRRLSEQIQHRLITLAGLSHDLRNPISRMLAEVAHLEHEHPDIMQESFLTSSLQELQSITDSVLDYARGGINDEKKMEISLSHLIYTVAENFLDSGADVQVLSTDDCFMSLYPKSIQRCLQNIVQNAVDYGTQENFECPEGSPHSSKEGVSSSTVTICGKNMPDCYKIEVRDFGPGIPEEELEHVFEPFVRLGCNSSNSRKNGTGIGLSIARNLAQANNATIMMTNKKTGLLVTLHIMKSRSLSGTAGI